MCTCEIASLEYGWQYICNRAYAATMDDGRWTKARLRKSCVIGMNHITKHKEASADEMPTPYDYTRCYTSHTKPEP